MRSVPLSTGEIDAGSDPAYPTITPPDPIYPCQTLAPIGPPLDGIATPSMWSRLEGPLARAIDTLWNQLGLGERGRPGRWITLQCGRIAVNAHGWERLQAGLEDRRPDPSLVPPPGFGLGALAERWEALRLRWRRRTLPVLVKRAEVRAHDALLIVSGRDPRELDTAELARGPLDEPSWAEILLPWLETRLHRESLRAASRPVQHAIALEQRFGVELGRRLVQRGVLHTPEEVAYLTVEERIRAVHEGPGLWAEHAAARAERVGRWVKIEIPERFWGRPRLDDAFDTDGGAPLA
jgi:hypothetical protein